MIRSYEFCFLSTSRLLRLRIMMTKTISVTSVATKLALCESLFSFHALT